ncbi:LysR substrate-binding domain-containing protein [Roseibium sp. M-1]
MEKDFSSREVEVFAAVMQQGTTTKAAEVLGISQPGVSKLIARFEEKAGFELFQRQRQRLLPTPEAYALFEEVEKSFISVKDISRFARDIRELQGDNLRIGALPALGIGFVPRMVEEFSHLVPNTSVTLHVRATRTLIGLAAKGQLDLAIGVTLPIDNPAVVRRQIPEVPIVCVMRQDTPLAKKNCVSIADLAGNRVISLLPTDPLIIQLENRAKCSGQALRIDVETNLAAAAMSFAAAGPGVAVVDYLSAVSAKTPELVIRPLTEPVSIQYSIYRQRGKMASHSTDGFIEHIVRSLVAEISRCPVIERL